MVVRIGHVPGASQQHLQAGTQVLGAPPGWLRLTVQGNRWLDNPSAPRVELNGYPVHVRYGENLVQVPAGRLDVDVHCRLLRRYGQARLAVDVASGGTVSLFYAPPHHEMTSGRLGHEPQKRAGAVPALGLALLALNLMLIVVHLLVR